MSIDSEIKKVRKQLAKECVQGGMTKETKKKLFKLRLRKATRSYKKNCA